jgi:hypothetical protein
MYNDAERMEPYPENLVAYPVTVKAAGIVWIIFGTLILVNMLVLVVLMSLLAARAHAGAVAASGVCVGLFLGAFGAAFILVGVQSVRGTAPGTLGNGIGSIGFGLFNIVYGMTLADDGHLIQSGIALIGGAGLLAAGVLALVGRGQYMAWRRAARPPRKS